MKPMLLSKRIMAVDDGTLTSGQVAQKIGCTPSYVRTVRQRWGARSEYDIKYYDKCKSRIEAKKRAAQ